MLFAGIRRFPNTWNSAPRTKCNYRMFTVLRDIHRNKKHDNTKNEDFVKSCLFTRRRYAHTSGKDKKDGRDAKPGRISFIDKIKGVSGESSPSVSFSDIAFAGFGTFIGIGTISLVHYGLAPVDETLILGSFGATSILIFGAPAAPFSQPRNVLGGHLVAAFCGVTAAQLVHLPFDLPQLAAPIAVSSACVSMMATRTLHPPAGGTALIAALGSAEMQELGYYYLVPTTFGATALICLGVLINNVHPDRAYPKYWFK